MVVGSRYEYEVSHPPSLHHPTTISSPIPLCVVITTIILPHFEEIGTLQTLHHGWDLKGERRVLR
jgi:hypothetical protein